MIYNIVKLKDVTSQITDGVHNTVIDDNEGTCYLLSSKNIKNGQIIISDHDRKINDDTRIKLSKRTKMEIGDVLITTVGTIGESAIIKNNDIKYEFQRSVAIIKPITQVLDPLFLYYATRHPQFSRQIDASISGSVQKCLFLTAINDLKIPLPPMNEQKTIARILGTLDDKIELNRRMNETLEGIARALFKSWFIDFDPVHAKAEGRQPFGMDEETAALFPDQFEESELGEIPKGWKSGTIGDIATNVRDQYDPRKSPEVTMPYIGLEHMPRGCIALYDWSVSYDLASGKFRFKPYDILFGKLRPYFHKVGIAPTTGICSTDILVIRPIDDWYLGYLSMLLSSNEVVDYADRTSRGTKMPRTSWADLEKFRVVLPPKEPLQRFARVVFLLLQRIINNIHTIKTLELTRDSLLPGLISGSIRVDPSRFGFGPEGEKVGEV